MPEQISPKIIVNNKNYFAFTIFCDTLNCKELLNTKVSTARGRLRRITLRIVNKKNWLLNCHDDCKKVIFKVQN